MKVGVAVPTYNVKAFVENCLTTIRDQTYDNVFAYICDDRSDDGTYEFLRDRPQLYRNLTQNATHLGWPETLNGAANLAIADACDAIFVMASDDWLRLDCIARCVEILQKAMSFAVCTTQTIGELDVVQVSRGRAQMRDFAEWPPIVNQALVHVTPWKAVHGYSTDVRLPGLPNGFMEDWDFWLKIFQAGFGYYEVVRDPVYYVRMHPGQLHKQAGLTGQERDGRVAEFRALMHAKFPELRS